jgi:hypothetical protein
VFSLNLPTQEELDELRAALARQLMIQRATLAPIIESATGMRAELEASGWSPTMAEQVSGLYLTSTMARVLMPGRDDGHDQDQAPAPGGGV